MDEDNVIEALKRLNEIAKMGLKPNLEINGSTGQIGPWWEFTVSVGSQSRSSSNFAPCSSPEEAICEAVVKAWNMPNVQIARRNAELTRLKDWTEGIPKR